MGKIQIERFLVGLFLTLVLAAPGFAQSVADHRSSSRVKDAPGQRLKNKGVLIAQGGESLMGDDAQEQALSLSEPEMLTRAKRRADALRAQLLDLQMKEMNLQARVDDLDYKLRPESIQRALALVGSVRPMDELRDDLRARLESEKSRVNKQLELLESTQERIEAAVRDADAECVRLEQRLGLSQSNGACKKSGAGTPPTSGANEL